MKKRTVAKIISFCLAAVLVCTGFIIKAEQKNKRYRIQLQNSYSRSLDDFGAAINNIATTLNKARFVTTPEQMSNVAAKLLTESEISKTALSQLPYSSELTVLNKFLSQVGNYAMAVSKNLISTGKIAENETQNIEKLNSTAQKIKDAVSDTQINYNNADYWAKELNEQISTNVDTQSLGTSFEELEGELSDYPTLIYDGPYSDHILTKEPEMLKYAETVSQNEALNVAARTAECNKSFLKEDGEIFGNMPSYRFIGEDINIQVTKAGGFAVYMRKNRNIGDAVLSFEQAIENAKKYLTRQGNNFLKETYYFTEGGICVINFAFVDGETICYTDLIKVGVAMDNGEIMIYEAAGYISNHTDRAFATPTHTAQQAQKLISTKLAVKSVALALIPTNSEKQERCYEFTCTSSDEQEILVYINATTLKEERILILLKSDGGILVK